MAWSSWKISSWVKKLFLVKNEHIFLKLAFLKEKKPKIFI